jgi:hypothetical protein
MTFISSLYLSYLYVLHKNGTNDVCNLSYHFSPLCWTDLSLQSFFYFSRYSIDSIDPQIFLTIVHLARIMMMYKFVLCLSMPLHSRREISPSWVSASGLSLLISRDLETFSSKQSLICIFFSLYNSQLSFRGIYHGGFEPMTNSEILLNILATRVQWVYDDKFNRKKINCLECRLFLYRNSSTRHNLNSLNFQLGTKWELQHISLMKNLTFVGL